MIDLDAIRERVAEDERYLRAGMQLTGPERDRRALLAEVARLGAALEIVTRDRDTLLEMTGTTVEQVAERIARLRRGQPQT